MSTRGIYLLSPSLDLVQGAAVDYGRILSQFTHHPVYILRGGYERFSGLYHFFRTQKIIWMPQVRPKAAHKLIQVGSMAADKEVAE